MCTCVHEHVCVSVCVCKFKYISRSSRDSPSLSLVSRPDPPISAALDVLHHQHAERKVWKLLHGFRVLWRNLQRTNGVRGVM